MREREVNLLTLHPTHSEKNRFFKFVYLFLLSLILRNDRGLDVNEEAYCINNQRLQICSQYDAHIIFFQSTSSRRQFLLNLMLVSG